MVLLWIAWEVHGWGNCINKHNGMQRQERIVEIKGIVCCREILSTGLDRDYTVHNMFLRYLQDWISFFFLSLRIVLLVTFPVPFRIDMWQISCKIHCELSKSFKWSGVNQVRICAYCNIKFVEGCTGCGFFFGSVNERNLQHV